MVPDFCPRSFAADSPSGSLFNILYTPLTWSEDVNDDIYRFVGFILQTAQAHNITIDGGARYNVPPGEFTISSDAPSSNLTSYTAVAIGGADDFSDGDVTIKDVFDVIVNNTREVTATCELFAIRLHLFVLLTRPGLSRNRLDYWVSKGEHFLGADSNSGVLSYISYGWPVRSVEQVPPYSPKKLKVPVLVIGNSVRAPRPRIKLSQV